MNSKMISMEVAMPENTHTLIGKIYKSRFRYFDNRTNKVKFKRRPVLIIGAERSVKPCDLTVLPISRISVRKNLNKDYDYELTKSSHEDLNLDYEPSYVRTHKVNTIHTSDLPHDGFISCVKTSYPEDYKAIEESFKKFTADMFDGNEIEKT